VALPEDKPPAWLTVFFIFVLLLAAARFVVFEEFFESLGTKAPQSHSTTTQPAAICGDYKCTGTENCNSCPTDCKCATNAHTVDLPNEKGRNWNIPYKPAAEKIKITASGCFYLDIFDKDGKEVDPVQALRGTTELEVCRDAGGKTWPTTGSNSESWFNWGGCADTKIYDVAVNQELVLKPATDDCSSCVCYIPDFDIYEERESGWIKVESLL
jgi:hypothetical protein